MGDEMSQLYIWEMTKAEDKRQPRWDMYGYRDCLYSASRHYDLGGGTASIETEQSGLPFPKEPTAPRVLKLTRKVSPELVERYIAGGWSVEWVD